MPIGLRMVRELNLIHRTISGPVTMAEILADMDRILKDPAFRPGMNSLSDIRESEHQVSHADVRDLADWLRHLGLR